MLQKSVTSIALICSLVMTVFVSSCDTKGDAIEDKSKIRVGIVFDPGGKDDNSFNAAAWEGVKRAANDFPGKVVLRDVEPGNAPSIEPAMRAFAERGFDLIIAVGFAQGPIMKRVATDYPNIHFAIIDGVILDDKGNPYPNVASLIFKEHEGSYLVGMMAANKSKTGVIGFLGGMDIDLIHRFAEGYEQGALSVNPNIKVIENYVGVTDAAWNNPGKGKELTLAQIQKGADVIFTAAGKSGLGAFDAVESYGKQQDGVARKYVIGVDSNQNWIKPGYVLTSMVKRVDNAVYQVIKERAEGKPFQSGFQVFGLDKDGVGYSLDSYNKDFVQPDLVQQIEDAKKKIIGGQIKVKDAMNPNDK